MVQGGGLGIMGYKTGAFLLEFSFRQLSGIELRG